MKNLSKEIIRTVVIMLEGILTDLQKILETDDEALWVKLNNYTKMMDNEIKRIKENEKV